MKSRDIHQYLSIEIGTKLELRVGLKLGSKLYLGRNKENQFKMRRL